MLLVEGLGRLLVLVVQVHVECGAMLVAPG